MLQSHRAFTPAEIDHHAISPEVWHGFVRRREFELIMEMLPATSRFTSALELGAGDGGQSVTIARWCDKLTCTEVNEGRFKQMHAKHHISNIQYVRCDARNLSCFEDGAFDFIFSSNMLEHVDGVEACLQHCRRVLSADGIMIHTMPTRSWKIWNAFVSVVYRRERPRLHGISSGHVQEWRVFGLNRWQQELESAGFDVFALVGLPFYFGHGPSPRWLIHLGNRLKWSATVAYYARKG